MLNKVRRYIEREIGLTIPSSPLRGDGGEAILVALSGGADSTALLLIMKELGFNLTALHCNFHLRGEESNRDQAFVEELCKQQGVPLLVRHFQTEEEARRRGISIEMAARDLRYAWFREVQAEQCSMSNAQCSIAVAHHRDDQAETLLLNLLRGTGLRGLAGMQPKHDGIIRPLLCVSREEILAYLEQKGQAYVTDSTNSERIAQRNKVRLDLIPLLRDINPAAIDHLCRACDNVRQSMPYYIKGIETTFKENGITADTFPLSAFHLGEEAGGGGGLLHEWLAGKGFNRTQEEEMLTSSQVGKIWNSSTHTVLRDREALFLQKLSSKAERNFQLHQEIVSCIGKTGPNIAYFDAELLKNPIEVRPVREGDAFVPFGMKGRKLVSDFLTDRKMNRLAKAEQFVATCGEDIIWLIGHRSDNRYRVTPTTSRILKLTIVDLSTF